MEKIICAAIRFQEKVWYGHRHTNALDAMRNELSYTMNRQQMKEQEVDRDQGFVTSYGRYVNREEAWKIAHDAGQILHNGNHHGLLYSEDLY